MQTNEYVHIQYTHIMNPSISLQPGHHYTISIKNEQSRDTGNIGHNTQNKNKQNKKHNTENVKGEQHRPHQQNREVNPGVREG